MIKLITLPVNALLVRALTSVLAVILLSTCTNGVMTEEDNTVARYIILSYDDFGPEAEPLLGVFHWQWDDEENRKPVKYDIKVVVYRDISLGEIKNKFPVNITKRMDYRYIEYSKSRQYIDKRIQDMYDYLNTPSANDNEDDVVFLSIIIRLYKTALKIEMGLGKP